MRFRRQVLTTFVFGMIMILGAFALHDLSVLNEHSGDILLFLGGVLVWLSIIRCFFRFMWSVTKTDKSTLYGGAMGANIRQGALRRWLCGIEK